MNNINYEDIATFKLKELREKKGLTHYDLAEVIGKTRTAYTNYENGTRKIGFSDLCKIAEEYDIPLDYFAGRDVETSKKIKYN